MTLNYYVYAITASNTPLPSALAGLRDAALHAVPWRDLAAVVSRLDPAELTPAPEHLLRHEEVVEGLRLSAPALPVRFGTLLADPTAVARALAERYATHLADLLRLGDKIELGITVLWNSWGLLDDGARLGREAPCSAASAPTGPGTQYLKSRLAHHRQEQLLRSRAKMLAEDIDGTLRRHSLESRCLAPPTARLALRAEYLLELSQMSAFREAFDEVRQERPHLRLLLSGPWPPYSFVTPASPASEDFLDIPFANSTVPIYENVAGDEARINVHHKLEQLV